MARAMIRQTAGIATGMPGPEYRMTIHGRTMWINLTGLLDRAAVQRLQRQAAAAIDERNLLIVLDGSRLVHLDYRCVAALVRWSHVLRGFGHRLILSGWNGYLTAILAMEDWEGVLEDESRKAPTARLAAGALRHVQVS